MHAKHGTRPARLVLPFCSWMTLTVVRRAACQTVNCSTRDLTVRMLPVSLRPCRKMILTMVGEPLVIAIKLADRLHNMRTV